MINLAVCLCFKDASGYLAEWMAYYRALGVNYFYLYDNGSTDDYRPIVTPYLRAGWAELKVWPGLAQQLRMYTDCLDRARGRVRWLGFLDDDEFLWPVVEADLPSALERYRDFAGVGACWFLYGSSQHEVAPSGLVIENYQWRARHPDSHLKCFVCPTRVQRPLQVGHSFACEPGFTIVDEHQKPIRSSNTPTPSGDFLRVNHYVTKSLQEMRRRRSRPQADTGAITEHSLALWEYWARDWNKVQDSGITRFLPAVRAVLDQMKPRCSL